jgi:hypothetical protein
MNGKTSYTSDMKFQVKQLTLSDKESFRSGNSNRASQKLVDCMESIQIWSFAAYCYITFWLPGQQTGRSSASDNDVILPEYYQDTQKHSIAQAIDPRAKEAG